MNQLSSLLRKLSHETWERIGFSRNRAGLKIFETTITQNLIYNIHLHKPSNFIIYEAIDESTNGNDIELFMETKGGFLFLAIQSKILYKKENYPKFDHGDQINNLIQYAHSKGGLPFYLLYNYSKAFVFKNTICGVSCDETDFGCTLIGANFLLEKYAFKKTNKQGEKKWIIPFFLDLHPKYAIPWFILTSMPHIEKNDELLQKMFPYIQLDYSAPLNLYSWDVISQSDEWYPLKLVTEYNEEPTETQELSDSVHDQNANERFAPKFRIILRSENS